MTSSAYSYCAGDKRAIDDAALLDHTATTELVWHLANAPINSKNFPSFVRAVIRAEKISLRVPAEQGASASAIEDFISSVNDLRILRFVLDGQHDRWRCLQCGVASHEELTSVYIAASKQLVRLPTARALQISHRSCSCSCCQRLQRKVCSVPAASARQQFTTRTAIFALGDSRTCSTVTVTRSQTPTKAVQR